MAKRRVYRILFHDRGRVYEIYARSVASGDLLGFVRVEGLLFGQRSQVVVDPSEEGLKAEFAGVLSFQLPHHAVIRVDEVEKEGTSRVSPGATTGTVASFPSPVSGRPETR